MQQQLNDIKINIVKQDSLIERFRSNSIYM
jgi:hypothetical protein